MLVYNTHVYMYMYHFCACHMLASCIDNDKFCVYMCVC